MRQASWLGSRLSDESRWSAEHTALLIGTLKWALRRAALSIRLPLDR